MGLASAFRLLPLPQTELTAMFASIQTKSVLTCPECGHKAELEMPTDACQFFHECDTRKALLWPLYDDTTIRQHWSAKLKIPRRLNPRGTSRGCRYIYGAREFSGLLTLPTAH